jgi:hypothetical protein
VKWTVQFEHPAQIELAEAFHHYNRLSFGLGGDFLRMVAAAEERLAQNLWLMHPLACDSDAYCCGDFRMRFTLKY